MSDTMRAKEAKHSKETKEAAFLLRKLAKLEKKDSIFDLPDIAVIKARLLTYSDKDILAAKAILRGDEGPNLLELSQQQRAPQGERDEAWHKVLSWVGEQEQSWVDPSLKSAKEIKKVLPSYGGALTTLQDAFKSAQDLKVPRVKDAAKSAASKLGDASKDLDYLRELMDKRVEELTNFQLTIHLALEQEPPDSMAEVNGTRTTLQNNIQNLRRSEQRIQEYASTLNAKCAKWEKDLEELIKVMCAQAEAWRKTKKVAEGTEWFETIANGIVNAVQVADSEPMSAPAVQGLHMLIKGVCTGIRVGAAQIKAAELMDKTVDDLVKDLRPDDFVQWKLDGIKMAIEWAAEPLGFIPNVGPMVRTIITTVSGRIIGILKEAAKKQAEALKAKKDPPSFGEEIKSVKNTISEVTKSVLEGGAEMLGGLKEITGGGSDLLKPEAAVTAFVLKVVDALAGEKMQEMLAEIIPKLGMVSPEAIQKTLGDSRAALSEVAGADKKMQAIDVSAGFDLEHARKTNRDAIVAMDGDDGGSGWGVWVGYTEDLPETGGIALLIGQQHSDSNRTFVEAMVQAKQGTSGTVTRKSSRELVFTLEDARGKEWVKTYIKSYGSGDNRVTGKTLTFE